MFPRTNYRLTLQVYDRDVFSGNDYIGDATFDFEGFAEDVFAARTGMKYNRKYYKKYVEPKIPEEARKYAIKWDDDYNFWVPVMCKNDETVRRNLIIGPTREAGRYSYSNRHPRLDTS